MSDLDVLSLDEAQAVIRAENNQQYDIPLAQAVTAVTALLETRVGPIVVRTITDEIHDGGWYTIRPYHQPVDTVTTVIEALGTSTTTLTAEGFAGSVVNGYRLMADGTIERRASGYPWRFACSAVKITYDAGRYEDTATVDPRFKEAAAITLAHNWGLDHGSGNSTFGSFDGTDGVPSGRGWALPNRALEILGDDRRIPGIA